MRIDFSDYQHVPAAVRERANRLISIYYRILALVFLVIVASVCLLIFYVCDFIGNKSYREWDDFLHESPYLMTEVVSSTCIESRSSRASDGSYDVCHIWYLSMDDYKALLRVCKKVNCQRIFFGCSVLPNSALRIHHVDVDTLEDALVRSDPSKPMVFNTTTAVHPAPLHDRLYRLNQELMLRLNCNHIVAFFLGMIIILVTGTALVLLLCGISWFPYHWSFKILKPYKQQATVIYSNLKIISIEPLEPLDPAEPAETMRNSETHKP